MVKKTRMNKEGWDLHHIAMIIVGQAVDNEG